MPNRALRELIKADIEQVFSLVDMAKEQSFVGNFGSGANILQAPDKVFADIEQRMLPRNSNDASPFLPLPAELRRAIENAQFHVQ